MLLTMNVDIVAMGEHLGLARKEFETNILPHVGLGIEDTAWKEPRKIIGVVVSYQGNYIYVNLEEYDIKKTDKLKTQKEMLKHHGWNVDHIQIR